MHDALSLQEQFETARQNAMALTDLYHVSDRDDPLSSALWQRAMDQTESARQLLELWLKMEDNEARTRERELALAV